MGRRAFIMGQTVRRCLRWLRNKEKPGNIFFVNHQFPLLGVMGSVTSGGNMIKNGSGVRIQLKVKEKSDSDARVVQGKIEKLRFRPQEAIKEFWFVTIPDHGLHLGLSAVNDCIQIGLATEDGGRISMGGKSYGWWSKMLKDYDDKEKFQPFVEALNNATWKNHFNA
jgi:hypothetical protein